MAQLRTFAFVRVDPKIKRAVEGHTRLETGERRSSPAGRAEELIHNLKSVDSRGKRPSIASRSSSDFPNSTSSRLHGPSSSLILQPARATPDESKWLDYIGDHLGELVPGELHQDEISELQRYWPTLTRYMDGRVPLEAIPVREGLKRKVIGAFFANLGWFDFMGSEKRDKQPGSVKTAVCFQHW